MARRPRALKVQEPDERSLIEAAQQDPRRFADLYEANFERVYAFVARRVPNRAEAEDLTSEVFHQALANLPRFEWRGAPFAAWLYRIAANAITDRAARTAKQYEVVAQHDPLGAQAISPEEIERAARLYRLVRCLPADQQRVIDLRFTEERSIREVAQTLGRSEGAVKQLQFRALETLRKRMEGSYA